MSHSSMDRLKVLMGDEKLPILSKPVTQGKDQDDCGSQTDAGPSNSEKCSMDTIRGQSDTLERHISVVRDLKADPNIGPENMEQQMESVERQNNEPTVISSSFNLRASPGLELDKLGFSPVPGPSAPSAPRDPSREEKEPAMRQGKELGELANPGRAFCPIKAVSKLPYKYVKGANREIVDEAFFKNGKFWLHAWSLYYIYPPPRSASKPLILVSAYEVQQFLSSINSRLGIKLQWPHQSEETGFLLNFSDDGTARPRFLGKSTSRISFEKLESMAPSRAFQPKNEIAGLVEPSDRSLGAFKKKMELAAEATKNKNKALKAKKLEQRFQKQQGWGKQLKRMQRYLGLRQRLTNDVSFGNPDEIAWSHSWTASHNAARVDANSLAPYEFDSSVVFIAVDVEAYERNHKIITEIGVATLDTLDLTDLPTGTDGKNWMSKIRARHFRIKEHSHLANKDFVAGCADQFEFGESEWISIHEAPQIIASCFRNPFSAPESVDSAETSTIVPGDQPKRNVVLVGHDITTDVAFLQSIGYDPLTVGSLLELLDTGLMYRSIKQELQSRSLGTVLYDLNLMGWNLHNAGNDAVYTLQVMIAMAFRDLGRKGLSREEKENERWGRVRAAVDEAVEKASLATQGWISDDEDGDGGAAVPPGVAEHNDAVGKKKENPNAKTGPPDRQTGPASRAGTNVVGSVGTEVPD